MDCRGYYVDKVRKSKKKINVSTHNQLKED